MPQVFRLGPYWVYFNKMIRMIEARSFSIIKKWEEYFGAITYKY